MELKNIDILIPYANNSRTHSPDQIKRIASSILEFGFTNPVLLDERGMILAGHGRVEAAKLAGLKEVPTITLTGLSEYQKKAYVIADNQLAIEGSDWDMDLLKLEVGNLRDNDFDVDLLGFVDLSFLDDDPNHNNYGLVNEDDVPEVAEKPITKKGDVWQLGDHRLMCGDSTISSDVETLMNGFDADFCFTSPPYGQQRNYTKSIDDWDALMKGVFSILPVKDSAQILVNLGLIHEQKEWQPYWDKWIEGMRKDGWLRFALYVWDQGAGMVGDHKGRLAPSFELIFHFCKENKKARKTAQSKHAGTNASRKGHRAADGSVKEKTGKDSHIQETKVRDSVIRVNRQLSSPNAGGHPAPFPVELCREVSRPWINAGDVCFEPFTGSGTQLINCENEGYIFRGMEIAPEYCDIAVKRWQEYTGKKAILESTGKTFMEVS